MSANRTVAGWLRAKENEVKGARFENGLLVIHLQREIPEATKPRRIAINGGAPGSVTQIESKAA
jgi:molecular chaperone IbpA